ncbi:sigma-70 RNA polymerase sigma factor region 4 domain-containing protein [Paraliomyxa miuraensis]|uniref:hypothetical protein n=1 Tax=Paraliomyxa miuraensis TaxID=376150 RepID=UPI00224FC4EC|nr:hypothetical protein [Paraliomyxa miuraensis]MCX4240512.1 hypothetical protein [Paraliomyxa miuraensis]
MCAQDETSWFQIVRLAADVVAKADDRAWGDFWEAIAPLCIQRLRKHSFLIPFARSEDLRQDSLTLLWERLQVSDYRKLRVFFDHQKVDMDESMRSERFRAWLWRVLKHTQIDVLRRHPDYIRHRPDVKTNSEDGNERWRRLVSLHSSIANARDGATARLTVNRLLEYLDESIPSRLRMAAVLAEEGGPIEEIAERLQVRNVEQARGLLEHAYARLRYRAALELWAQGYGDGEIARRLALGSAERARRTVDAAKESLRRAFQDGREREP